MANDAIGNFAVATPLLQIFQARGCVCDLLSGPRVQELAAASPLVAQAVHVMDVPLHDAWAAVSGRAYDLVANLEHAPWAKAVCGALAEQGALASGPCVGTGGRGELPFPDDERGDLWRDREWASEGLPARFPFLETGHISEVFVRLLYLDDPVPGYSFPSVRPRIEVPPVLIALSASLPSKLWPVESWIKACTALAEEYGSVGLLGAPRKAQGHFYKGASDEDRLVAEAGVVDLRGALSLPEVVGALDSARLVLTLDNGILHLAAAGRARIVGLFRPGIVHLWCPRRENITALVPQSGAEVADIPLEAVLRACNL